MVGSHICGRNFKSAGFGVGQFLVDKQLNLVEPLDLLLLEVL